jgi:hypothetical protein
MNRKSLITFVSIFSFVAAIGAVQYSSQSSDAPVEISNTTASNTTAMSTSYIVQAESLDVAKDAVEAIGGEITHELGIIHAVGAILSAEQLAQLAKNADLKIQKDRSAAVSEGGRRSHPCSDLTALPPFHGLRQR